MSESAVATRHKVRPYARLFVADEVRVENNGKLIAIGLYSDGVILFRVPKNAPPPTAEMPYGIDSLALVAVVGGFDGETTVRISLGKNKPLEQAIVLKPGRSANLHLALKPFRFASFGVKTLNVEFGGAKFKLPFEIRAEYIDAVDDLESYMQVMTSKAARVPKKSDAEDAKIVRQKEKRPPVKSKARRP